MIRTPKYVINSKPFTSQDGIKKHFQGILKTAKIGEPLSGEELEDCIALFMRHPEWSEKKGVGVKSVQVINNPVYGDRCFWIYRTDGSTTDISYLTCVKAKKKNAREQFMAAARFAVVDQILEFKRAAFGVRFVAKCEITGRMVSEEQCHIDHVYPFSKLVDKFIKDFGIDIEFVEYKQKGDGDIVTQFAEEYIEIKWQEFHLKFAELQVTHREANQAKGCKDGSEDTRLLP